MSRSKTSLTTLAAAFAVLGCAAPQQQQDSGLTVKPVLSVRHGVDPQASYRTGRYFQGQVRFDEAIANYQRVLAEQPDHAGALNAMGVIYSLQRRPDLAERSFRAALASSPGSAEIHNNLGYHLMVNGRLDEALSAFERARAIEPSNRGVAVNLAEARGKLGLAPEASQSAQQGEVVVVATAATAAVQTTPVAVLPAAIAPAAVAVEVVPPATFSGALPQVIAPTPAPEARLERVGEGIWSLTGLPVGGPQAVAAPAATAAVQQAKAAAGSSQPAIVQVYPSSTAQRVAATTPSQPRSGRIEIANGNGVTGLARSVSVLLAPMGLERPRLTNDRPFGVNRSSIQYVSGAEQMARDVNLSLPQQLPLLRVKGLERNAPVRVLLGKDFPPKTAQSDLSTRRNS